VANALAAEGARVVVGARVFLASARAANITGSDHVIDGGLLATV
jgi:hypothetical protein